jgi:hypothetical protein
MSVICPVCKREWGTSIQIAKHIFGTNDAPHHKWVDEQGMTFGYTFDDLLIDQVTQPGNTAYETLAALVDNAQRSIQPGANPNLHN